MQMFKPQELANAIWAFASLDYQQPELVGAVAARCLELGEAFKEQELSNVLWAFGECGVDHETCQLETSNQQDGACEVGSGGVQEVCTVLWGFGEWQAQPSSPHNQHMRVCMLHACIHERVAVAGAYAAACDGVQCAAWFG